MPFSTHLALSMLTSSLELALKTSQTNLVVTLKSSKVRRRPGVVVVNPLLSGLLEELAPKTKADGSCAISKTSRVSWHSKCLSSVWCLSSKQKHRKCHIMLIEVHVKFKSKCLAESRNLKVETLQTQRVYSLSDDDDVLS